MQSNVTRWSELISSLQAFAGDPVSTSQHVQSIAVLLGCRGYRDGLTPSEWATICVQLMHTLLDVFRPDTFQDAGIETFDSIFLQGVVPHHEAFIVLASSLATTNSAKQDKILNLLGQFVHGSAMKIMFIQQCSVVQQPAGRLSSAEGLLWDQLVTLFVSLPQRVANKLGTKVWPDFELGTYYHAIASGILHALSKAHHCLTEDRDTSLEFLCRLLGRLCLSGQGEIVVQMLTDELIPFAAKDFVWRRIAKRIFAGVRDMELEAVVVPLLLHARWYGHVDWMLQDSVCQNHKLQYLLTTKLLLVRVFQQESLLQNVVGYLSTSDARRPLYIKVVEKLLDVWGDPSVLKHQAYPQQLYMSQALVVCAAFLKIIAVQSETKQGFLGKLLEGVRAHISSPRDAVRVLGMCVAECLIPVLSPESSPPKFEYEKTAEIIHLFSLLQVPQDPGVAPKTERHHHTKLSADAVAETSPPDVLPDAAAHSTEPLSQLDSDDDLEPYDMSNDVPLVKSKRPAYIRDCLQGLVDHSNPDWTHACLEETEKLVRAHPDHSSEVATELAKVLLHLDDSFSIPNFTVLRYRSLVAITVCCPQQVAEYLTQQFYDRNYNIRQRLDILEVLAMASQELSRPKLARPAPPDDDVPCSVSEESQHWRDVIQKRIDSKTRRIGKGRKPEPEACKNRFGPVAGYFFFPLLQHFDRKDATLDLLGEDSYVLGRLLYALGIILNSATNTPVVRQMGQALLEFIWALKYHAEAFVRQALMFALIMAIINIPAHTLVEELQVDVSEWQQWFGDVLERDPDPDCRQRASQVLSLLAHTIKQAVADQTTDTCS